MGSNLAAYLLDSSKDNKVHGVRQSVASRRVGKPHLAAHAFNRGAQPSDVHSWRYSQTRSM